MQPGATILIHEPSPRSPGRLLERERGDLTANRLLEGTHGRGLCLVLITTP